MVILTSTGWPWGGDGDEKDEQEEEMRGERRKEPLVRKMAIMGQEKEEKRRK